MVTNDLQSLVCGWLVSESQSPPDLKAHVLEAALSSGSECEIRGQDA